MMSCVKFSHYLTTNTSIQIVVLVFIEYHIM